MQSSIVDFDPFTPPETVAINTVRLRDRVAVAGTLTELTVCHWAGGTRALHLTVTDDTGSFRVAFLGRTGIAGIHLGEHLTVGGTVIHRHGQLIMMNPFLWLPTIVNVDEHDIEPLVSAFA